MYDYKKADWENLCNFLLDEHLSQTESGDVEEAWSLIKHSILSGMEQFIKKVRNRSSQLPG